ncbi:MAG TPA: SAM-dependent methyltransferase [Clostridiales bacterium]|jgi:tRNA (adenine22-N1)-methyltransferase|nr:SAM-dependent methyltransferase [Clostridiales bacterium]
MIKLSERLTTVAGFVEQDDRVADIGSDHGHLPIYLYQNGISRQIILSDLNDGPLEKARKNLAALAPDFQPDIRQGDGLAPLQPGEVDTVVMAGMGGLLICDILAADPEKTKSFRRFVLEPENAEDKVRAFLFDKGFAILAEKLARDKERIYQVLVAAPNPLEGLTLEERAAVRSRFEEDMLFEISPLLVFQNDPLLPELIAGKIRQEEFILAETAEQDTERSRERCRQAEERLAKLRILYDQVTRRKD